MLTALKPQTQVLAYVPRVHTFTVILRDRFDQEEEHIIKTDSDRFCYVLAIVQAQYPGKAVVDSWEIA